MIYKEVSSNLEFLYHYIVRVFCLQGYMHMYTVHIGVSSFQFIFVVAPDYLKSCVIILHNTCYNNLILIHFFSHSPICS